jgi:U3 small nucleolar RNA-associated protein 25
MQNWDHLVHLLEHMNRIPSDSHGCDFSRIRPETLDGRYVMVLREAILKSAGDLTQVSRAKYLRQTLLLSEFASPEMNSVFARHMSNVTGKVKLRRDHKGSITSAVANVHQTFMRVHCNRSADVDDARFKHFTEQVCHMFAFQSTGIHVCLNLSFYSGAADAA